MMASQFLWKSSQTGEGAAGSTPAAGIGHIAHKEIEMNTPYESYRERRAERQAAEAWNTLPAGPKYTEGAFKISPAHCRIELTRAGQQSQGGRNYWETGRAFNSALIQELANHPEIIAGAIARLREAEHKALENCRTFAEGILADIESGDTMEV